MKTTHPSLAILQNLLEDEFRDIEGIRIRPVFPTTTSRSPDLEQDYDPESASLHRTAGVRLQTRRHEYFFPVEWVAVEHHARVVRLIDEIRENLGRP